MMRLLLLSLFYTLPSFASDTTWLNNKWRLCKKDTATYVSITKQRESLWNQRIYYIVNNGLYMNGYFAEPSRTTKNGPFTWYDQSGQLTDSIRFTKGEANFLYKFHKNGKVRTELLYSGKQMTSARTWDINGNEVYVDTFYCDDNNIICNKDTASYSGVIEKQDSVWRLRLFLPNNELWIDSYYKERICSTKTKYFVKYEDHYIRDSVIYDDKGRRTQSWLFHKKGIRCARLDYDTARKIIAFKNWDENGNESAADTMKRFPVPPGGLKKWEKDIIRKINKDETIPWKERKNLYGTVYIGFVIDDNGRQEETLINEPSIYPAMDSLVLKACETNEIWKPYTAYGRREYFHGYHFFSFVAGKIISYRMFF